MLSFVLEIGSEEIPARFLPALEKELMERFESAFTTEGVSFADLQTMATPRRSVVSAKLEAQTTRREELIMGPPVRIAFDAAGAPTKAALGFAKTQGVEITALFRECTDKGEYLATHKELGGEMTLQVLERICPEIITQLPFPKRMHWGCGTFSYARPLRWLLALLDEQQVSFEVGGVKSGKQTFGHRIHGLGPFMVNTASDYFKIVKEEGGVTVSPRERREKIIKGGDAAATAKAGLVLWKEKLLDEVQGLTEHPIPLLGDFDPSFLEIPREVLLTSMESHQKSFGIEDPTGALLPHFLTVLNITPQDQKLVKKGWERVLRARLEDARFFWKTDLSASFESWLESLDSVIFLAPLGSMGDKTRRLEQLCAFLAEKIGADVKDAARSGRLSKADLVSGMVGEFDSLQGIMGGIYAAKKGESSAVSLALQEQYLPAGPDSPVPGSIHGAILSLADKADTLVGCFGLGLIPTGTVDPYALRRCALGIARIIQEHHFDLNIVEVFTKALSLYEDISWKYAEKETLEKLVDFFTVRLKNLLVGQGNATLFVEAVLNADSKDVRSAHARLAALKEFSTQPDFEQAAITFKRVANIIRKQEHEEKLEFCGEYKPELLHEEAEKNLAAELENAQQKFDTLWAESKFLELLLLAGSLRPAVDAFFDSIMVMDDDMAIRRNRLELLAAVRSRMNRLADFSALQL